jgi:hypothetical protein
VPLLPDRRVRGQQRDYLHWDAFAWALARHVQHRNGPHRDKRIRLLEARHQIAA